MIVVDAAPIIYLSRTGNLSLLRKLYGKLLIPQGVWDEVVTQAHGRPGASEATRGAEQGWIKTERVLPEKSLKAEGAEGADAETIALAKKTRLSLLTNDKALTNIAKTHGVQVKWLTQAIIEAVQTKIITPPQARALIRDLVREGLRVRSDVLAEIIHRIEET